MPRPWRCQHRPWPLSSPFSCSTVQPCYRWLSCHCPAGPRTWWYSSCPFLVHRASSILTADRSTRSQRLIWWLPSGSPLHSLSSWTSSGCSNAASSHISHQCHFPTTRCIFTSDIILRPPHQSLLYGLTSEVQKLFSFPVKLAPFKELLLLTNYIINQNAYTYVYLFIFFLALLIELF